PPRHSSFSRTSRSVSFSRASIRRLSSSRLTCLVRLRMSAMRSEIGRAVVCSSDLAPAPFVFLPDIEEREFLARFDPALELFEADLLGSLADVRNEVGVRGGHGLAAECNVCFAVAPVRFTCARRALPGRRSAGPGRRHREGAGHPWR